MAAQILLIAAFILLFVPFAVWFSINSYNVFKKTFTDHKWKKILISGAISWSIAIILFIVVSFI